MRRSSKWSGDEASVDMTPMLDIVFIMLIFFIVAAVFLDEQGLPLKDRDDSNVDTHMTAAIPVYIDGQDRALVDGRLVDIASVPSRVEAMLADQPQASVVVTADAQTSVEAVIYLKDRFLLANLDMTLKIAPDVRG